MVGRNPDEPHRVATTLELLFDLTFVVAISLCGSQLAHAVAAGHASTGILGFGFGMFGILWAWINYTWFASAFDTDDWAMRIATLVQMVGVVVLGLGQAPMFAALEHGEFDCRVLVAGYVVMRTSMVYLWLRVAAESPDYRDKGRAYAQWVVGAQVVWVALAVAAPPLAWALPASLAAVAVEFVGLYWVQTRAGGPGTPWHPHHITERYGLLVIIALGEVVLGTTTAVAALVDVQGWSLDAAVVAFAGVALSVAVWWGYFAIPWGELLSAQRAKSFGFGYGHLPLYAAIAAIGAGLHVVAYYIEGEATIASSGAIVAVAAPLALAVLGIQVFAAFMVPRGRAMHRGLAAVTVLVLVGAVAAVMAGLPLAWGIGMVVLSPWTAVVAYERLGHAHLVARLGPPSEHGRRRPVQP